LERVHTEFDGKARQKRDHQEGSDVAGRVILKWILREIGLGGMDWIPLPQDRDQWQVLTNTIMNLRVTENFRTFLSR
jgi:hypothetical protein